MQMPMSPTAGTQWDGMKGVDFLLHTAEPSSCCREILGYGGIHIVAVTSARRDRTDDSVVVAVCCGMCAFTRDVTRERESERDGESLLETNLPTLVLPTLHRKSGLRLQLVSAPRFAYYYTYWLVVTMGDRKRGPQDGRDRTSRRIMVIVGMRSNLSHFCTLLLLLVVNFSYTHTLSLSLSLCVVLCFGRKKKEQRGRIC